MDKRDTITDPFDALLGAVSARMAFEKKITPLVHIRRVSESEAITWLDVELKVLELPRDAMPRSESESEPFNRGFAIQAFDAMNETVIEPAVDMGLLGANDAATWRKVEGESIRAQYTDDGPKPPDWLALPQPMEQLPQLHKAADNLMERQWNMVLESRQLDDPELWDSPSALMIGVLSASVVLRDNPDDGEAYLNRGMAYGLLEEYDLALADYNRAIKLDPKNPKAFLERGIIHFDREEFHDALRDMTKAIKLDSHVAHFFEMRSEVYNEMGNTAKAVKDISRAIDLEPEDHDLYRKRSAYYSLDNVGKAMKDIDKAIMLNSDIGMYYRDRAAMHIWVRNFGAALDDCDTAINMDGIEHETSEMRGIALYNMGAYEESLTEFDREVSLSPFHPDAYNCRGRAYKKLGKIKEAVEDFNRASALGEIPVNQMFTSQFLED